MKEVTIKTIGWNIFGVVFLIMFYGMFIALSISNMDSEIRTIHTFNMDNQTKDAIKYIIDNQQKNIIINENSLNQTQYLNFYNEIFTETNVDKFCIYKGGLHGYIDGILSLGVINCNFGSNWNGVQGEEYVKWLLENEN